MICSFCHSECNYGAQVCRGCQAEIKYNEQTLFSKFIWFLMMIVSVPIGFFVYKYFHHYLLAYGIAFLAMILGRMIIVRTFKIKIDLPPQFYRHMRHGK